MPNGRNAERIFGRNADRAECQKAECRQLLPDFGQNAETLILGSVRRTGVKLLKITTFSSVN